jgi:hypothetical protein
MYKDQVWEGLSEADQTKLESLGRDIQIGIDQLKGRRMTTCLDTRFT